MTESVDFANVDAARIGRWSCSAVCRRRLRPARSPMRPRSRPQPPRGEGSALACHITGILRQAKEVATPTSDSALPGRLGRRPHTPAGQTSWGAEPVDTGLDLGRLWDDVLGNCPAGPSRHVGGAARLDLRRELLVGDALGLGRQQVPTARSARAWRSTMRSGRPQVGPGGQCSGRGRWWPARRPGVCVTSPCLGPRLGPPPGAERAAASTRVKPPRSAGAATRASYLARRAAPITSCAP